MKMPFGKNKDEELTEIPKGYLRWLHSQKWLKGPLAAAVDEALGEKAPEDTAPENRGSPAKASHHRGSSPVP